MKNQYIQILSAFLKKNISLLLIGGSLLLTYYGAIKLNPMQQANTQQHSTTKEQFAEAQFNEISVIKFFAPWCAPCRKMEPIFKRTADVFASQGSKCQFASINIDEQPSIAEKYKIRGIPAIVIVDNTGQVKEKIVGLVSQELLTEKIGNHCVG